MGEQASRRIAMDIDLNLEPNPDQLSYAIGAMNLNDMINPPLNRTSNLLDRHTWENVSMELDRFLGISRNPSVERIAVVPQPQPQPSLIALSGVGHAEVAQACEISNVGVALDKSEAKKENVDKGCGSEGGFYDCNICLGLAKDPVVTRCGHLFCWPCLYRWLHLGSSGNKKCPVCKGEVKDKKVIPIYGGGNEVEVGHEDSSSTLQIPRRPNARRKDSNARQSRQGRVRHLGRELMTIQ